jgi:hypothetical protein
MPSRGMPGASFMSCEIFSSTVILAITPRAFCSMRSYLSVCAQAMSGNTRADKKRNTLCVCVVFINNDYDIFIGHE